MHFDFTETRKVNVSIPKLIKELLEDYADIEGNTLTPATNNVFSVDEEAAALSDEEKVYFHTGVTKLLYLSKRSNFIE